MATQEHISWEKIEIWMRKQLFDRALQLSKSDQIEENKW